MFTSIPSLSILFWIGFPLVLLYPLIKWIVRYFRWWKKFYHLPRLNSPPIVKDFSRISLLRHTPHKLHRSQFKETGWFVAWASYYPFIYVFKSKPAHTILSNTNFLSRGWPVNVACSGYENLVSLDGQRWKDRKCLAARSFSIDVIQSFLPIVVKNAENLVNDIETKLGSDFSFYELFIDYVMSIILETSIGLEKSSQWPGTPIIHRGLKTWFSSQFDRLSRLYLWFEPINILWQKIKGDKNNYDHCISLVREVIENRLKSKGSDHDQLYGDGKMSKKPFLSHMVDQFAAQSVQSGNQKASIDFNELLDETLAIIVASYETVANTSTWTLFNLACNPSVQERLYQELINFDDTQDITIQCLDSYKYLDQCVSENLRLRPPVGITLRNIEQDITLDNSDIPKNTLAAISIYAIHHDESIYPSPDIFDPDRFNPENRAKIPPGGYIPFGEGPRRCIGGKLGLTIVKIILAHMIKRFVVTAINPEKIKIRNDIFTRTEEPIMLSFTPRS
ncbi:cytochrome P450 4V2-like [Brevipalpus obovatus]|uniref:cytochrome P450 4V2-like n=1 Tax=Brevipalpus obovatus TaxID=246614 RepID=UPI003D9FA1AC